MVKILAFFKPAKATFSSLFLSASSVPKWDLSNKDNFVIILGNYYGFAYGAPRFSDNLDFTALFPIKEQDFTGFIKTLGRRYPNVSLSEARKKRYTLFALFKIKEEFLKLPFGIKVEISTRRVNWQVGVDYEVRRLTSLASGLVVVGKTATLSRMWQEKKKAVKSRAKSRDVYDLWYLGGRLGKKLIRPEHNLSGQQLKADLHRVLPKSEHYVVDFLVSQKK